MICDQHICLHFCAHTHYFTNSHVVSPCTPLNNPHIWCDLLLTCLFNFIHGLDAGTVGRSYVESLFIAYTLHSSALHCLAWLRWWSPVYSRCQNYRTESGVQKYGKIPYLRTPPDPDSARIRILFYNYFFRSIIIFPFYNYFSVL